MIALPILAAILAGCLIWAVAAPNSTPNNWLPSHRQEQPQAQTTEPAQPQK